MPWCRLVTDAHVGRTHQIENRIVLVMLRQQVHRPVARPRESVFDAPRHPVHALLETAALAGRAARWRRERPEHEAADPRGPVVWPPIDRIQPFDGAVGAVVAVNVERDAGVRRQPQAICHAAPAHCHALLHYR